MSTLKFTDPEHWAGIERHLGPADGRRSPSPTPAPSATPPAARCWKSWTPCWSTSSTPPAASTAGACRDQALDQVHNHALATGHGIVEFHNHQHGPPGFSPIDEDALAPTVRYCLELLGGTALRGGGAGRRGGACRMVARRCAGRGRTGPVQHRYRPR